MIRKSRDIIGIFSGIPISIKKRKPPNYFFPLYDRIPIEISDRTIKIAPKIVMYLPVNSLPIIKPSPIPPIIPIDTPVLSIPNTSHIIGTNRPFIN